MSQWTHIAGIIRFDVIRCTEKGLKLSDFTQNLPTGSEGSANITLWEDPCEASIAAYTLSIFGDLRDYNSIDDIQKYLNQISKGRDVRQGIVEVDIEGENIYLIQFDHNKKAWIKSITRESKQYIAARYNKQIMYRPCW